ncbi:cupin domain-containing protein [Novosphingobium sp. UBA1939]|uniref:cupin domain-containing protein n=1 Tax=Novosphingobium sp. UBA1939 TaxID=1946982 RepID=UPI0025F283F6|nr:cupin domain-containing protein [Novosphingobium sp. UBA1939]
MGTHPPATILRGSDTGFNAVPGSRFEMRENGLQPATGGAYTARIFRATSGGTVAPAMHWHDAAFQYVHILKGKIEFLLEGGERRTLRAGDAIWQPTGCLHCVTYVSADLELLEIFSPADIATIRVDQ